MRVNFISDTDHGLSRWRFAFNLYTRSGERTFAGLRGLSTSPRPKRRRRNWLSSDLLGRKSYIKGRSAFAAYRAKANDASREIIGAAGGPATPRQQCRGRKCWQPLAINATATRRICSKLMLDSMLDCYTDLRMFYANSDNQKGSHSEQVFLRWPKFSADGFFIGI